MLRVGGAGSCRARRISEVAHKVALGGEALVLGIAAVIRRRILLIQNDDGLALGDRDGNPADLELLQLDGLRVNGEHIVTHTKLCLDVHDYISFCGGPVTPAVTFGYLLIISASTQAAIKPSGANMP